MVESLHPQPLRLTKPVPHRRGSVLVYAIFACIGLTALASLSVDLGAVQLAKTELQSASDSAALAGATGLSVSPSEARARAKSIAGSNKIHGRTFTLLDSDIDLGIWNATTRTFTKVTGAAESTANCVRINGQLTNARGTSVSLPLLSAVSRFTHKELAAVSMGCSAVDSADVVVAQDVSGSFQNEIGLARLGDAALLNSLNVPGSKSNFGLVSFTGTSKTLSLLSPVQTQTSSLLSIVNLLNLTTWSLPSILSGTDISTGIDRAHAVMNSGGTTGNNRCIVVVSDGEPSPSYLGANPGYSAEGLLTLAQQKADIAWADGIHVYVVFWDSENSTASANKLRTLIRGRGTFTHVTDPANLPSAIGMILRSQVRLVR